MRRSRRTRFAGGTDCRPTRRRSRCCRAAGRTRCRGFLPTLVAAAERIRARVPGAQFVVARAPSLDDHLFDAVRAARFAPMAIVEGDTDGVLASADVALTASGTATVQAALHDTPMVVVYRLSPLTYRLGRRLVQPRHVRHGESDRRREDRPRADSGRVHAGRGRRRSRVDADRPRARGAHPRRAGARRANGSARRGRAGARRKRFFGWSPAAVAPASKNSHARRGHRVSRRVVRAPGRRARPRPLRSRRRSRRSARARRPQRRRARRRS